MTITYNKAPLAAQSGLVTPGGMDIEDDLSINGNSLSMDINPYAPKPPPELQTLP